MLRCCSRCRGSGATEKSDCYRFSSRRLWSATWPKLIAFGLILLYQIGIVVQAMRYLRRWQWRARDIGIGLTRVVVIFAIALVPVRAWMSRHRPPDANDEHMRYRAEFSSELNHVPGEQLAIVRYSSDHDPGEEWVYNRADIDHAKIVWAREIPGEDIRPLLDYFRNREVWLVEPDADPPKLTVWPQAWLE